VTGVPSDPRARAAFEQSGKPVPSSGYWVEQPGDPLILGTFRSLTCLFAVGWDGARWRSVVRVRWDDLDLL
jgi:hypothetical protein